MKTKKGYVPVYRAFNARSGEQESFFTHKKNDTVRANIFFKYFSAGIDNDRPHGLGHFMVTEKPIPVTRNLLLQTCPHVS